MLKKQIVDPLFTSFTRQKFIILLQFFSVLPLNYKMVELQLNKILMKFRTLIQESNSSTYQVNLLSSNYSKEAISSKFQTSKIQF